MSDVSHEVLQAWKSGLDSMIINVVEVVKGLSLSCLNNYLDGTLSPLLHLDQWNQLVKMYPDYTLEDFELNEDLAMITQCLVKQIAQKMENYANLNDFGFFLEDEICYAGFIAKDKLDLMQITNWVYETLNTDVTLINHRNIPEQLNIIAMSCLLTDKTFQTMSLLMEKYRGEENYNEETELLKEEIQQRIKEDLNENLEPRSFLERQKDTSYLNYNIYENNRDIEETIKEAMMDARVNGKTKPEYKVEESKRMNKEEWSKNWWKQENSLKLKNKKMTEIKFRMEETTTTKEKLAIKSALINAKLLIQKLLDETKELKLCSNYYGNKYGIKMLAENQNVELVKTKAKLKELNWKNPWCIKKDEILKFLNLKNRWKTRIALNLMIDQK